MSYKILSKFIKDISFEIPDANAFLMLEKEISNYSLNFDISSKKFKNNIIEVNTILRLSPNLEVKNKILSVGRDSLSYEKYNQKKNYSSWLFYGCHHFFL